MFLVAEPELASGWDRQLQNIINCKILLTIRHNFAVYDFAWRRWL
jgi:hypothetical protein